MRSLNDMQFVINSIVHIFTQIIPFDIEAETKYSTRKYIFSTRNSRVGLDRRARTRTSSRLHIVLYAEFGSFV